MIVENEKYKQAVSLLREKYEETGAVPKRSDFDSETVCLIKQKLGPWPRALEAAGLKKAPAVSAKEKSILKRERAKARRKEAKRNETSKKADRGAACRIDGADSYTAERMG